jgi:hypothetical protein
VRGDSLRDFYAKTLALVGLGLLAAVGALVDYWPVGADATPDVVAVDLGRPEPLAVPPAVNVDVPAAVARSEAPVAVMALEADLGVPPGFGLGQPLAIAELAAAPAIEDVAVAEPVPPAPAFEVAPVEPPLPLGPDFDPSLVYPAGAAEDDDGLLADAMGVVKSTGSTIARGGAITGASIVGAFRAVSGAFKKLKFF